MKSTETKIKRAMDRYEYDMEKRKKDKMEKKRANSNRICLRKE